MSTITLKNIRVGSDLQVRVRLKDGDVAIDWTTLTGIKAYIYSDAQRAMAGRCAVSVSEADHTVLVCDYAATKPQYLGVSRIIVTGTYNRETKTYDKPAFTFVRWTADQEGEQIQIDDPDVEVEIEVQDVSSSIIQEAVEAAFSAAERANEAAAAAEHMVDIHTGPAGKSAYEVAVEEGYTGTEEEWLASLKGPVGETPDISIGTVTTVEPGTSAAATMTGTPEAPVLNLAIPKGVAGDTPNFTVGEVTTGQPGTPVVVTITGTAAAPVLNIQIPQGLQGNPGSSVDYPFELVNNATTNDATKAATAAVAKGLKDDITQLEHEVHNLSGKYYGVHASSATLPVDADASGYAFVGSANPYAIWNFDGTSWSDSGSVANGISGEPGIGFSSIFTPLPYDGTMIIVLSNNDTITVDLNHNHEGYYSKVLGEAQPSGGFLPDVVYSLGTLTGTITFTLAAAVTGNVNHYFWMFDTGSTAPTITFPSGITWADGTGPTVAANKHYEISILGGIAYYSEV